jgi:hypothetical protein
MDSLAFVARAFLITVALVLLMQVNVGEERLEYKVADYIRGSVVTTTVQGVADGAVKFIRNAWNKVSKSLGTGFSNAIRSGNRPGERDEAMLNLERSKEYVKKHAKSARDSVKDYLTEEGLIEGEAKPVRPKREFVD